MSENPSTPSSEQSDKTKKYDRQLRLWGDHGQVALEVCHICLINASASGTETLKSLVLPGVGAITIIDNNKVTMQDLGNNFFLDHESLGLYRGEIALHNLLELNSDVRGTFVDESVEEILDNRSDFFSNFNVVIATMLRESSLINLSTKLWEAKVPLLVVRSYGMIGYVRLQVEEATIIESHPDNTVPDLRLDRPFTSLKNFVDNIDLNSLSNREHSHVPYVVILLHYLQKWKEEHSDIPKNYPEKKAFKQLLRSGMREKNGEPEENFEEALKAVNTMSHFKISAEVREILSEATSMTPSPSSPNFWLLAKALHEFVESEGKGALPVSGIIPDMTADSETFIKLQNL